jgi:DNA repair protein RecO (recombination protein O)
MALYREQGLVLRSYKLGEADRIVNVLSQGRGKVRAVVKGVRRPSSRFGARLEPFSHVDLQLAEGRNLEIVSQAELITSFAALRNDYAVSACAATMSEAADRVAQEGERFNRLFVLLHDGLSALATGGDPVLVTDAYLMRLASVAGYHLHLHACLACGAPGRHAVFSIAAGGALCPQCAPVDGQPLEPGVTALLSQLAESRWDELATDGLSTRERRAAGALVHRYVTYHLGKPLSSWELVPR